MIPSQHQSSFPFLTSQSSCSPWIPVIGPPREFNSTSLDAVARRILARRYLSDREATGWWRVGHGVWVAVWVDIARVELMGLSPGKGTL